MIFVEGYSLVCSLGDNAKSSVHALKNEQIHTIVLEDENKYYPIKNRKENDYYDIMENVAKEAIKDANLTNIEIASMGLFLGTSSPKLPMNETLLKNGSELLADVNIGEITEILLERLKMKSFNTLISTACTSSSNALLQAKEMIDAGLIQKALVLGVELYNELSIKGFDSFLLLSQDKIRPFDKNRDGVILGEGLSAVVLGKKESNFELCSGSIFVDISSITSPTADSLKEVMADAVHKAQISAKEIQTIKAHSTATIQNDAVEADAINALFPTTTKVTSFKPYIGHTMGACGSNELVLLMESLNQGFIPRTINFEEVDKEHALTPLIKTTEAKNGYYLLNYFGFGGNNCCLVMNYNGA